MLFGTLEVLATIIITIAVVKLIVISLSPRHWLALAERIYKNPRLTSIIALVLAAVVLYFLSTAGVTIIEIFAVTLFVSLLMVMSMARLAKRMVAIYRRKDRQTIWKEHGLDLAVWILLLLWGISALLA